MTRPEGFEFRPANENELAQVLRLGNYVFASPPKEDDPPPALLAEWTHCAFRGEDVAATSGGYPFLMRMNGKTVPVQGVTLVGTEPEYRRRGIVRQLITDLLHRAKDEGQAGSTLLASRGAIYQRFGYGLAHLNVGYSLDPRKAVLRDPFTDTGHIQRLGGGAARPIITELYKHYARPRNVFTLRADMVWDRLVTQLDKDHAYCAVHFNKDSTPDGYAIYETRWVENTDHQEMRLREFFTLDIDAYKAIWQYLTSHDLVEKIVADDIAEDDPAPALLLEPRCLNRRTWDGQWFRVVDAASLLAARGYDIDGRATLRIVGDDLCPWNNGTLTLAVSDHAASVSTDTAKPDLSLGPNALASLVTGCYSATRLVQLGMAEVADESSLRSIDALFGTRYRGALSFGF